MKFVPIAAKIEKSKTPNTITYLPLYSEVMSDNVCENGYEDLEEDYTIGEEYQVEV